MEQNKNIKKGPRRPHKRGQGGCLTMLGILLIIIAATWLVAAAFATLSDRQATINYGELTEGMTFEAPGAEAETTLRAAENVPAPDSSVSDQARPKRTLLKGNGQDQVTVMVYVSGADTETVAGMATEDIKEMLAANTSAQVNVILETGGTQKWDNTVISSKAGQRYKATGDGLSVLEKNLGVKDMADPAALADFITYCRENYPADRYGLILWGQGGGAQEGVVYDQLFPDSTMSADELGDALAMGGCAFDFIGFDAGLMAGYETILAAEPYADYLIASEETAPAGWYYTDWLTVLSENPSMETVELGKMIADGYVKAAQTSFPDSHASLSIIDLAEFAGTVPAAMGAFARSADEALKAGQYKVAADARRQSGRFAGALETGQVDLAAFARSLGLEEGVRLADALAGCVKYQRVSEQRPAVNGISIYMPSEDQKSLDPVLSLHGRLGMDKDYIGYIQSYAAFMEEGRKNPALTGDGMEADRIGLTEKDGAQVIALSPEEQELVEKKQLHVYLDEGEAYADLGFENMGEFDADGNMAIEYDGTWLSINQQIVSYEVVSEERNGGQYTITGRVPALLNRVPVDLS